MMILIIFNFFMSILFLFMKHPMSMGLNLLIQTILTSLLTGLLNNNFFFSYILFLIFISGMLIMFLYMTSVASNEIIKISNNIIFLLFFLILNLSLFLILDNFLLNMFNTNLENMLFNNNINIFLKKFFNSPNYIIMMMMILYLLLTLIATVKIINISYGPLRQNF